MAGYERASYPAPQGAPDSEQIGIQSVEIGMKLLSVMVELSVGSAPLMLKTIAAAADMAPAKAYRYMVSLLRTGMVERDLETGRYRLGAMSRHIGVNAIRAVDVVKTGASHLPHICASLQQSVAIAVWAYHGPTIVAVEDIRRPITISTRVGEVMPMLASATGRVFGAWMPRGITQRMIDHELRHNRKLGGAAIRTAAQAEEVFAATREAGLGWTTGGVNAGINALSLPIFDYHGNFAAALSALGPADSFDVAVDGKLANDMRAAAAAISKELGCQR